MQPVLARLNELLQTDDPFLLVGPNGLKLHLIAKSMYDLPPKKQGSFVAIEGELADEQAIFGPMGALKRAAKGVLLICHLDRMPITLQEKLACEIAHLKPKAGSTHPESRFRFCATSVWDLHFLTATRHISPAMLGLLQENEVKLPPLSQRREEIPQFVEYFLAQLAPYRVKHVTKDCMDALQKAPWPGQLEALEQVLTEALAHLKGSELALKDLPAAFFNAGDHSAADAKPATDPSISMAIDLNQPFRDAQLQADHAFRAAYLRGLLETEGNVSAAARAAQMDRANFRRLLKKYLQD
jgi:two-component system nitrogen regulation response regulator GlnG